MNLGSELEIEEVKTKSSKQPQSYRQKMEIKQMRFELQMSFLKLILTGLHVIIVTFVAAILYQHIGKDNRIAIDFTEQEFQPTNPECSSPLTTDKYKREVLGCVK